MLDFRRSRLRGARPDVSTVRFARTFLSNERKAGNPESDLIECEPIRFKGHTLQVHSKAGGDTAPRRSAEAFDHECHDELYNRRGPHGRLLPPLQASSSTSCVLTAGRCVSPLELHPATLRFPVGKQTMMILRGGQIPTKNRVCISTYLLPTGEELRRGDDLHK